MKVTAKEMVGGHPVLEVRRMLRRAADGMSVELVCELLKIDEKAATSFIAALEGDGYIERQPNDEGWWRTTVKGNALTMASAAPPLQRPAADKLLLEFLTRVEQVRDEPNWCFKVDRVILFGSYLSSAPTLGDVDIAIALRRTHTDAKVQEEAERRRRDEAVKAGRRFSNMVEQVCWPEIEVKLFLKDRQRLSLHDLRMDGPVVDAGPHALLFSDERIRREAIPLLNDWSDERSRAVRGAAMAAKAMRASKRDAANRRKLEREQAEIEAKVNAFKLMSVEELRLHAREIQAIAARYDAIAASVARRVR